MTVPTITDPGPPEPLVYTYPHREAWLAARAQGIGASEVAAALGESPFASPYKVWAEKVAGRSLDDGIGEAAEWGLALERPIARRFGVRSGRKVALPTEGQYQVFAHPLFPFLRATPDAWQWPRPDETDLPDGELGLLQVKCADVSKRDEWKHGPPLHYEIQQQLEMAVCGVSWGSLIVLVGGNRLLGPFDALRCDDFFAAVLPALQQFWRAVETKTPPAIDGSHATARALKALYPEDSGETVHLSEYAQRCADELEEVKRQIKALEAKERLLQNHLRGEMKSATIGLLPGGGHYSLRTRTRGGHYVKPSTYRVLERH